MLFNIWHWNEEISILKSLHNLMASFLTGSWILLQTECCCWLPENHLHAAASVCQQHSVFLLATDEEEDHRHSGCERQAHLCQRRRPVRFTWTQCSLFIPQVRKHILCTGSDFLTSYGSMTFCYSLLFLHSFSISSYSSLLNLLCSSYFSRWYWYYSL